MFISNTEYTATITLTPKAGYTLTGVTANSFTVEGATTTNSSNSGTVSAVFIATTANLSEVSDVSSISQTGITFKAVQGGTFSNGIVNMTVSSFRLSQNEITMEQFIAVTGLANPSTYFTNVVNGPVQNINWYHALVFCNRLSVADGLTPVYSIKGTTNTASWGTIPATNDTTWNDAQADWTANGYRLPTEAEWQFAAMGGNSTNNHTYAGSNTIDGVAWYAVNAGDATHPAGTHPVGGKAANELGLYDMSGNVWEWCWDWYASYPTTAQTDYRGEAGSGSSRVLRGGSCFNYADYCTVDKRGFDFPYYQLHNYGVRIVLP